MHTSFFLGKKKKVFKKQQAHTESTTLQLEFFLIKTVLNSFAFHHLLIVQY